MENIWILFAGGLGAGVLGLLGIMIQRRATPIRDILSREERASMDNQILVTEGKRPCPGCGVRYIHITVDFCETCIRLRSLQRVVGPAEPLFIPSLDREVPILSARSHWGYTPLYQRPGFEDLFERQEE